MAKGFWLSRTDGIFATGKSPYQFDKWSHSLNRRGKNGHTRQFFIPEWQTTEDFRSKNIPCQEQLNSDILDQLVSNVDFNTDDDDLSKQLKQARLQKIKTDTKLINEKLDERKKLLFNEWSQSFFQSFSDHFGKLRNCLVQMHLNEQQIKIFNQTLEKCLQNMSLDLNKLYEEFKEENENE